MAGGNEHHRQRLSAWRLALAENGGGAARHQRNGSARLAGEA
jgi:hypothetical protein